MLVKVPLSWLREYCDIPWSTDELADRLTMTGLEVDSVDTVGPQYENIVVGAVTTAVKHPNADRLTVCTVDIGTETVEIICGAPNVAEGQRVPVALVGARLSGDVTIKRTKIRGVASQGMICSESELGLSDRADGIMVLDPETPVGEPLTDVLGQSETVLSFDVLSNRPDCLAMTGIAREITAMTRNTLRLPSTAVREAGTPVDELASVTVANHVDCPRFAGRVITGIRIASSPAWIIRRLEAVGLRAINNVVDVTNYVMLELGQPLHAYDLDTLAGQAIIVRRAREGESFTTLDGIERKLSNEILMITDRDRDIGIAGIMGGLNTEISNDTTAVFLEGACFDAMRVRHGSKHLGLSTDASRRFEREVDPELQGMAVDRAAQLIAELTGGEMAVGRIDVRTPPQPVLSIRLRVDRVNALLGTSISQKVIVECLEALGFSVKQDEDLLVEVPSSRPDITREVDLVEEVARLYGYDRIEPTMSSPTPLNLEDTHGTARHQRETRLRWKEQMQDRLRDTLVGSGFSEVITHSFAPPDDLRMVIPECTPLILDNPLSTELSAMRTTLIVPILNVVSWNSNRKIHDIRIFEIGRVFMPEHDNRLPAESIHLCVAMTGQGTLPHWSQTSEPIDFFDIKGIVETTLGRFALDNARSVPYDGAQQVFDVERSASLMMDDKQVGAYGAVSQTFLDHFDIQEPVWIYTLDCEYLIQLVSARRTYRSLPKYPAVERDLAIVVPENIDHQSITDVIRGICGTLLEEIELFDVYRGKQIPAGKKSLAYALWYRSHERTLTDEDVSSLQTRAVTRLGELYEAELR